MIYLDNAATTAPDKNAVEYATNFVLNNYLNPSSDYGRENNVTKEIEKARRSVANYIGVDPNEIIFTSSGSEANKLALLSAAFCNGESGRKHIVTSSIEHSSVIHAVRFLMGRGFEASFARVDSSGQVSIDELIKMIRPDTCFVSIMNCNNEIGVINNLPMEFEWFKRLGIITHSDCVQSLGNLDVSPGFIRADMMSFSAHKVHGLKGTGFLVIKSDLLREILRHDCINPFSGGISQEFGVRSGTENVVGILTLGAVCESLIRENKVDYSELKTMLYNNLKENLKGEFDDIVTVNGGAEILSNPSKVINLRFNGFDAETLIMLLASKGVYVSSGSACNAGEHEPSHVLKMIGLTDEEAMSSVRFSFSKLTTKDEIVKATKIVKECLQTLRR